jgi:hypothetical protein
LALLPQLMPISQFNSPRLIEPQIVVRCLLMALSLLLCTPMCAQAKRVDSG